MERVKFVAVILGSVYGTGLGVWLAIMITRWMDHRGRAAALRVLGSPLWPVFLVVRGARMFYELFCDVVRGDRQSEAGSPPVDPSWQWDNPRLLLMLVCTAPGCERPRPVVMYKKKDGGMEAVCLRHVPSEMRPMMMERVSGRVAWR